MAALATINTGMSLGAHQGVHPFFEKKKRKIENLAVAEKD